MSKSGQSPAPSEVQARAASSPDPLQPESLEPALWLIGTCQLLAAGKSNQTTRQVPAKATLSLLCPAVGREPTQRPSLPPLLLL
eukprot:scaffold10206_cov100-Isochrysis_galbana.AAC.2